MKEYMKKVSCLVFCVLIVLGAIGCHKEVAAIWTGNEGYVPISWPSPAGFSISPAQALAIAETHFGKKKVIQHIYADTTNYYIVNGFAGSSPTKALKEGVGVNGMTGECTRMN